MNPIVDEQDLVGIDDLLSDATHRTHGEGQGGQWGAAVRDFGGIRIGPRGIEMSPALPPAWDGLDFAVRFRGGMLRVQARHDAFRVVWEHERPVKISVAGKDETLEPGVARTFNGKGSWKPSRLKTVIFDLDGVLVSTDGCHYQAWKEIADEQGIPFDRERNHALRGVSREESLRRVYGTRPLPSPEKFRELCDRKNERYKQLVSSMTPADVLPGMLELLESLRDRGIRVAVASASRNAGMVMSKTGLAERFDAVIDGSMVRASKPDPHGFTLAALHCRSLPWECIGIEDSAAGIEAIRRAGMVAIGVGPEGTAAHERVELPGQITLSMLDAALAGHSCELMNPFDEFVAGSGGIGC